MPAEPAFDRLLLVSEVAAWLRINPQTVRRWLKSGKLKGFMPGGQKMGYRVYKSDVEQFLGRTSC